jgi:hypothetical protein
VERKKRGTDIDRVWHIQRYFANWTIGPSTLRSQGVGVADVAKRFLTNLDFNELANVEEVEYISWLNDRTTELMGQFPEIAQNNWGAARKAINLLMVGAYFNGVLSREYDLCRFRDVLETPLDNKAAKKLRRFASENLNLRLQFPGIRNLTPEVSKQFQNVASEYARREGIPRAELDIILWLDP